MATDLAKTYHNYAGIVDFFRALELEGDETVSTLSAKIVESDAKSTVRLGGGRADHIGDYVAGSLVHVYGATEACGVSASTDNPNADQNAVLHQLACFVQGLTLRQHGVRFELPPVAHGHLARYLKSEGAVGKQLGLVLFFVAIAHDVGERDAVTADVFSGKDVHSHVTQTAAASYKVLVKLFKAVKATCTDVPHLVHLVGAIASVLSPGFGRALDVKHVLSGAGWNQFASVHEWPLVRGRDIPWLDTLTALTRIGVEGYDAESAFVPLAFAHAHALAGVLFYAKDVAVQSIIAAGSSDDKNGKVRAALLLELHSVTFKKRVTALYAHTVDQLCESEWYEENAGVLGYYTAAHVWTSLSGVSSCGPKAAKAVTQPRRFEPLDSDGLDDVSAGPLVSFSVNALAACRPPSVGVAKMVPYKLIDPAGTGRVVRGTLPANMVTWDCARGCRVAGGASASSKSGLVSYKL